MRLVDRCRRFCNYIFDQFVKRKSFNIKCTVCLQVDRIQCFKFGDVTSNMGAFGVIFQFLPQATGVHVEIIKRGRIRNWTSLRRIVVFVGACAVDSLANISECLSMLRTTTSSSKSSRQMLCNRSRGRRVCGSYCWGSCGHPWTKLLSANCCAAARPWQI